MREQFFGATVSTMIYFHLDGLSCGHERVVETAVDIDRDQPWETSPNGRIGSPTVCYQCEPRSVDVIVMTTKRIPAPIDEEVT